MNRLGFLTGVAICCNTCTMYATAALTSLGSTASSESTGQAKTRWMPDFHSNGMQAQNSFGRMSHSVSMDSKAFVSSR